MDKLLLGSILLVPSLIALYGASIRNPRTGLRRTITFAIAFLAWYVLAVMHIYFRLA